MLKRIFKKVHDFKVEHKISEGFIRTSMAVLSFLVASMGTYYYKVKLEDAQDQILAYQRFFGQNAAEARAHEFFKYIERKKITQGCEHDIILFADLERTRAIAKFCLEWLGMIGEESLKKKDEFKAQLYFLIAEQDKVFYKSMMDKGISVESVEAYEKSNPDLTDLLSTLSSSCNGSGVVMAYLDVKLAIYENNTTTHCLPSGK